MRSILAKKMQNAFCEGVVSGIFLQSGKFFVREIVSLTRSSGALNVLQTHVLKLCLKESVTVPHDYSSPLFLSHFIKWDLSLISARYLFIAKIILF